MECKRKDKAFTLVELMVVVLIIGMLAWYVAPKVFKQLGRTQQSIARSKMSNIENALGRFRIDCGRFPDDEEGLEVLMELIATTATPSITLETSASTSVNPRRLFFLLADIIHPNRLFRSSYYPADRILILLFLWLTIRTLYKGFYRRRRSLPPNPPFHRGKIRPHPVVHHFPL